MTPRSANILALVAITVAAASGQTLPRWTQLNPDQVNAGDRVGFIGTLVPLVQIANTRNVRTLGSSPWMLRDTWNPLPAGFDATQLKMFVSGTVDENWPNSTDPATKIICVMNIAYALDWSNLLSGRKFYSWVPACVTPADQQTLLSMPEWAAWFAMQ